MKYVWIVLVIMLFSIPSLSAQIVDIPDENLRAAIAETLGKAADVPITLLEMGSLKVLRANDRGISDLTGLETASRLRELHLNRNTITDLSPLSGLTKLYRLELNHNGILSDLSPLSSLPNLKWLFLEDNAISDLSPLTELLTLHDLRLGGGNIIEDLSPVAGLHNLGGISIGNNLITDLTPLKDLKKLEWINMSGNPPADLTPLSGLMSLRSIHSWGTPILDLAPLKDLPKLRVLDICGGEISDISALAEMTTLTEIYLVGNDITDISSLASLTNLTRLNLSENDISDVSVLADLQRLKWLAFTHNAVSDVSAIEGLFDGTVIVWHTNPAFPSGGTKIVGPWLWVLVPGDRITDGDALSVASDGRGTEQKVATVGASEDKRVGNSVWVADTIAPTGKNIGEMLKRQGVGNNGIVYGSATIESPIEQQTRMFVGHRDGIRLYLNGDVVYQKNSGHWQEGYHVYIPVTLKAGTNVLLVGLDNHPNHVNQFHASFGFDVGTEYTVNKPISRDKVPAYDVNEDGHITILDLILVGQDYGKSPPVNARSDVNGDGRVNITDIVLVAGHLGEITGIPAAPELLIHKGLSPTQLSFWIKTAQAEDDGSLVFRQGIANLQQLLTTITPQQTLLLANYPNPFNPETWIPYQLAAAADVTLTIYAADGQQVRKLAIGHQPAGRYENRSRAVYWDGRNQVGEPVASGLYFYTLSAGKFTATRKMLIMK